MKKIKHIKQLSVAAFALFLFTSCNDKLNELKENESYTSTTDYTISANMIKPLVGAYTDFSINRGWADFPLISVRGDDVNSGGGNGADQYDYYQTDLFTYNKDYWMYNSVWTSMLSLRETFERRIGLYPAGFDAEGVMYANTAFGDYPLYAPTAAEDHGR